MMKTAIIQGSARSNGNTSILCKYLSDKIDADIIDLKTKNINPFDYNNPTDDDFLPTLEHLIENYELLVFATPVYWYSMSGIMKNFFDRITDLLHHHKPLARKLANISMGLLSCGSEKENIDNFEKPFVLSAHYLDMKFLGYCHGWIDGDSVSEEVTDRLDVFVDDLGRFTAKEN